MILPFEYNIPIKTFNHHISLFGALLADENALPLVYNTFINLRLNPNNYNYLAPMGYDRIAKNYDIVLNLTTTFDFGKISIE